RISAWMSDWIALSLFRMAWRSTIPDTSSAGWHTCAAPSAGFPVASAAATAAARPPHWWPRRTVKSETSVPPFIMISAVGWWNATVDRGGRLEHQKDFRAEYWPARSTTPDGTLSLPNSGTRLQAPGESW